MKKQKPTIISMNPSDWSLRYSPGMPKHPSAYGPVVPRGDDLAGWQFDFPLVRPGSEDEFSSVNYLTTNKLPKLRVGQCLSMLFQVMASDAVFEYALDLKKNPCPRDANVRLYFQKGTGNRWWSVEPISSDLTAGGALLSAVLSPEAWSNDHGQVGNLSKSVTKDWIAAVAGCNAVGVTFGGGCFYGHGVWLSRGSATFIVRSYKIEGA